MLEHKLDQAFLRIACQEDVSLLLARRERVVNPMAGCEKVLYAIRPEMAASGIAMGVNRFYGLMRENGLMVPKRRKYSCTQRSIQDSAAAAREVRLRDAEGVPGGVHEKGGVRPAAFAHPGLGEPSP